MFIVMLRFLSIILLISNVFIKIIGICEFSG